MAPLSLNPGWTGTTPSARSQAPSPPSPTTKAREDLKNRIRAAAARMNASVPGTGPIIPPQTPPLPPLEPPYFRLKHWGFTDSRRGGVGTPRRGGSGGRSSGGPGIGGRPGTSGSPLSPLSPFSVQSPVVLEATESESDGPYGPRRSVSTWSLQVEEQDDEPYPIRRLILAPPRDSEDDAGAEDDDEDQEEEEEETVIDSAAATIADTLAETAAQTGAETVTNSEAPTAPNDNVHTDHLVDHFRPTRLTVPPPPPQPEIEDEDTGADADSATLQRLLCLVGQPGLEEFGQHLAAAFEALNRVLEARLGSALSNGLGQGEANTSEVLANGCHPVDQPAYRTRAASETFTSTPTSAGLERPAPTPRAMSTGHALSSPVPPQSFPAKKEEADVEPTKAAGLTIVSVAPVYTYAGTKANQLSNGSVNGSANGSNFSNVSTASSADYGSTVTLGSGSNSTLGSTALPTTSAPVATPATATTAASTPVTAIPILSLAPISERPQTRPLPQGQNHSQNHAQPQPPADFQPQSPASPTPTTVDRLLALAASPNLAGLLRHLGPVVADLEGRLAYADEQRTPRPNHQPSTTFGSPRGDTEQGAVPTTVQSVAPLAPTWGGASQRPVSRSGRHAPFQISPVVSFATPVSVSATTTLSRPVSPRSVPVAGLSDAVPEVSKTLVSERAHAITTSVISGTLGAIIGVEV